MQAAQIPYMFATPWGANAAAGFIMPVIAANIAAGGVPPDIADMNGGLLYETLWTQWLQAGGPSGYDAAFSTAIGGYPKGAVIASATPGEAWLSTVDNNTTDPDAGGAGWVGAGV